MSGRLPRRTYLLSIAGSGAIAGCLISNTPSDQENTDRGSVNEDTNSSEVTNEEGNNEEKGSEEAVEEDENGELDREGTTEEEETESEKEPSAEQPKIREVQDNFGNTFTFDGDASGSARVGEEIVVSDETEIELCVTNIEKQENETVTYSYWFGNQKSDHPNNTDIRARIENNCWGWHMQRDHYSSGWRFSIWVRNEDDIYYQNSSAESDYRVTIHYNNLTLATESGSGAEQPKIREVQDNFGNTFTFDGDASGSARVDDEIVVSDETEVELCVTDIEKQENETVTYSYWFGNQKSDHPDNTNIKARLDENCRKWDMQRDHYSSGWRFSIWIRNEDDTYYQNSSAESDFRVTIHYNNLTLESRLP